MLQKQESVSLVLNSNSLLLLGQTKTKTMVNHEWMTIILPIKFTHENFQENVL